MCVLCSCKASEMSFPVLTLAGFFFLFFCAHAHFPGSPAHVMFSSAKVAADHHPQSDPATVGGSTRYACFVITLPKSPTAAGASVDGRLISPIIFFSPTKAMVSSKKSCRVRRSAEACRGVHWKDLVRRGAVVLISPQSKPSSVRSLLSDDLFRGRLLTSLATFWVPPSSAFSKVAYWLWESKKIPASSRPVQSDCKHF